MNIGKVFAAMIDGLDIELRKLELYDPDLLKIL